MNVSQLYEQELNFICNYIRNKYNSAKKVNLKAFKEDLIKLYEVVSPELLSFLNENVFTDKDLTKQFLEETLENGFLIHQQPFFNNIKLEDLAYLYNEVFDIPKIKFENIDTPLVFGEIYYMKLKHLAHGKYSVRSAEMSNLLDVPYKNNEQYKKGTALFNANPLALGEQEFFALATLGDTELTEKFRASYSSSRIARQTLFEDLFSLNDINDLDKVQWDERMTDSSAPAQTIKSLFAGIGVKLDKKIK